MKIREKIPLNPGKICVNLGKMCENLRKNRFVCFDFTKMAPERKVQTFYWRSCFFSTFSCKLGEIWASLEEIWAKMVLEVL